MTFTFDNLTDLTKPDGGRYAVKSLSEAFDFCSKLALGHYENFPVGSLLLPKLQRKYIFAVYAFARIADDIADEHTNIDKNIRILLLSDYQNLLEQEPKTNPIFSAVNETKHKFSIPNSVFSRLIEAFKSDADFQQPNNITDLENYCNLSANPVGELVLRIFNQDTEENINFSNKICTGLQLVNFWQDFSIDLKKERYYIPEEILSKYNLSKKDLVLNDKNINLVDLLNELYGASKEYFTLGKQIIRGLKPLRLKLEIAATVEGGLLVLEKTKRLGTKIFLERPKLNKSDVLKIMLKLFKYWFL